MIMMQTLSAAEIAFVAQLNAVSRQIAAWAENELRRGNTVQEVKAKLRKLADIAEQQ